MPERTIPRSRIGGGVVITIFKDRQDIPRTMEYVELNDLFFNQNTVTMIDGRAEKITEIIDAARLIGKYRIKSRFDDIVIDIDKLSAGCKTVLNVLYYPDKVFCLKECGNNALEVLYSLEKGYVCSEYALIPFNMGSVVVQTKTGQTVISDYEKLKEWWDNEE